LDSVVRERLLEALARSARGPFGNEVRLALVEPDDGPRSGAFGTYGFIRGARAFLAGLVRRAPGAYMDYGYVLEKVVLEATEWGLGTCWLGGTFSRSGFARGLEAGPEDAIPAVMPIGKPAARGTLLDGLLRLTARSATRKGRESLFFRGDFQTPLSAGEAGSYEPCLEAVRLAPSAANRQPWRIVREDDGDMFRFFVDRPPARKEPSADIRDIDLGIAMCHFELVAGELGLEGAWECGGTDAAHGAATDAAPGAATDAASGAPWDPVARWIGRKG